LIESSSFSLIHRGLIDDTLAVADNLYFVHQFKAVVTCHIHGDLDLLQAASCFAPFALYQPVHLQ
jgi:hypothetical protein